MRYCKLKIAPFILFISLVQNKMQKSFQDEDDVGMARDLAWLSDISASKRYAWNTPSSVESNSPNKNKSSAKRSQLK